MQETAGLTRSWFEIKEEVARAKRREKRLETGTPPPLSAAERPPPPTTGWRDCWRVVFWEAARGPPESPGAATREAESGETKNS
jgi:hypothetical protein